ncbi:helix-turn-helix domain-containing protein [Lacticaseibacillus daqingensis]|uniref:hypothetical protein n=1 Tax=Lacticaseibacillus daqingensis TaxID=2486014 RepID=UPI000F78D1B4|nr:hypothetical protein [Lacticaseibacillus daqingensis]
MMPIKRAPRKQHFTIIPNAALEDDGLSFKARGLLSYMLSKSDDWVFYERELIEHTTEGRAAVRSALKELEACGYLIREQGRRNGGGFGNSVWTVFDTPQRPLSENRPTAEMPQNQQLPVNGPTNEQPLSAFASSENVSSDNRPLPSTDYTKNLLNQEKDTTTTLDPLKQIQRYWENHGFGTVNGGEWWQEFGQWLADFEKLGASEADATAIIERGMLECVEAGADTRNLRYLRTILNRYANSRLITVAAIEADAEARKSKRERRSKRRAVNNPDHLYRDTDTDWEHMEGF